MDMGRIRKIDNYRWAPIENVNSVVMYGSQDLIAPMDEKLREQIVNVASLPGLNEMGTLGSGNHYLEIQVIKKIYDEIAASNSSGYPLYKLQTSSYEPRLHEKAARKAQLT